MRALGMSSQRADISLWELLPFLTHCLQVTGHQLLIWKANPDSRTAILISSLWNKLVKSRISPRITWITSPSEHTPRLSRAPWVLCSITASVLLGELLDAPGEEPLWRAVLKEPEGSCGTGTVRPPGTAVGLQAWQGDATQAQRKLLQAVLNSLWILLLSPLNSERG